MGDGGKVNELRQVVKNPTQTTEKIQEENDPEKIQEENEADTNEEEKESRQATETAQEEKESENQPTESTEESENQPTESTEESESESESESENEGTETNEEELMEKVAECLLFPLAESEKSPAQLREELRILVLCFVDSTLSTQLYDAGFLKITNAYATISSVTTGDVFERCNMRGTKWRNMSFTGTEPEFTAEEFNAVVDDGLDALLESERGKLVAKKYLHQVKSILKGKYICITSARSHILDLLFTTFRFGWEMGLHTIAQNQEPNPQRFLVVAEKKDNIVYNISIHLDANSGDQAAAVEKENKFRDSYPMDYSTTYIPGHILHFMLFDSEIPEVSYKAILLDAKQGLEMNEYYVLILPKYKVSDWLYSSEEGQWDIVESCRTTRLLMVFLDTTQSSVPDVVIKEEIGRLAMYLAPACVDENHDLQIRFLTVDDLVKRESVYKVRSGLCGVIAVEDLTYLSIRGKKFRSLSFIRCQAKRFGDVVTYDSILPGEQAPSGEWKVEHTYLGSLYHRHLCAVMDRIVPGFPLQSKKVVVLGLGAGLLPMFFKLNGIEQIEVVESNDKVLQVATSYFALKQDDHLKVHSSDEYQYIKKIAKSNDADEKIGILILDATSKYAFEYCEPSSSPHGEYRESSFLEYAKESLVDKGVLVLNLITEATDIRDDLHTRLEEVFGEDGAIYCWRVDEDSYCEVLKSHGDELRPRWTSTVGGGGYNEIIIAVKGSDIDKPRFDLSLEDINEPWTEYDLRWEL